MKRRELIRAGILAGVGAAASSAVVVGNRKTPPNGDPGGEETIRTLDVLKGVQERSDEDILIRMQREVVKAMAKPVEERHWIMVIDVRKCVGCHACTIGCIAENKLPPGVVYRPVLSQEAGEYPNLRTRFTPRPCMQCDSPPCVPVCPVKATWKRADGVVTIDYDKCIGCRYCLTACPYGSRTSDFGLNYNDDTARGAPSGDDRIVLSTPTEYETRPSNEYSKHWTRKGHKSPIGNARKCHFCLHRLEVGQLPMCTTTCIGRATYFGDSRDSDSLVVELITRNNTESLLAHKNTKPQVFYII